ncbi:hypothetical protein [Methylobacterium trifolii]|uniref:hypothetical protein n=1 Tax=Methylobacterium trifolii TaxID=1003092 RepID=UPI001EDE159B|nr:hypothetical protein [Methylobacterium trifolii]
MPTELSFFAANGVIRLIRAGHAAPHGLRGIYKPGFRYKKTGILLLDLAPADSVQGSLFLRPDDPRRVAPMLAVDVINLRYNRDRVQFAATGVDWGWATPGGGSFTALHHAPGGAVERSSLGA